MDCLDLVCPEAADGGGNSLGLLGDHNEELLDGEHNATMDKCGQCQDCTRSGYSVCVQRRHFDEQRRQLVVTSMDEEHGEEEGEERGERKSSKVANCECAHSGPAIATNASSQLCRILATPMDGRMSHRYRSWGTMEPGKAFFRVCYASALRKLPTPKASNENEPTEGMTGNPVLVTVDPFWKSDYWRALRPRQLNLFYLFPVTRKEHCEAKVQTPNAQDMMWINAGKRRNQAGKSGMPWLCKTSLRIVMNGIEDQEGTEEKKKGEKQEDEEKGEDEFYDGDGGSDIDPDMLPEVHFERDVFAGADKVRFYYELNVHRENQLRPGGGKPRFESREISIRSDNLDFDLRPEIYGTGLLGGRSRTNTNGGGSDRQTNDEPIGQPADNGEDSGTRFTEGAAKQSGEHEEENEEERLDNGQDGGTKSTEGAAKQSGEHEEENVAEGKRGEAEAETGQSTKSAAATTNIANSSKEHELLLRDILLATRLAVLVSLLAILLVTLLAVFLVLAFCYKRGLCCFAARNGCNEKIRIQDGKEYGKMHQ